MIKIVGVLALQGAFAKHIEKLEEVGAKGIEVRTERDLECCDALIIPGGESTTLSHLLNDNDILKNHFLQFVNEKPIFGTCAGLILMAKETLYYPNLTQLGVLDIVVRRNAYGRQVDSFTTELDLGVKVPAVFIRAPQIESIGSQVRVLATFDSKPVLVQQGRYLGASFHPELTNSCFIHEYFLSLINL